ncbi:MAG: Fpg/Nei family DNA glycosylase [Candidatus Helarchaeota archaeon]
MPELPDLEIIKDFLDKKILHKRIRKAEVLNPIIIRSPSKSEFINNLEGKKIKKIERFGKFLLFRLDSSNTIVFNLMRTGKFEYLEKGKKLGKYCLIRIIFQDYCELRYMDSKKMGKIYLTDDLNSIPTFSEQGPDILDVSLEKFQDRIKRFRGQIKNVLINQKFVRGIGNAYVDEILFDAGIYPFRKRNSLNDEELKKIYESSNKVLTDAIAVLKTRIGRNIDKKIRNFLKIHNKGGEPCPNCGNRISQLTPNKRITSYCKYCQK